MAAQGDLARTPPRALAHQLAGAQAPQMSPSQLQARALGSLATAEQLLTQALARGDGASRYTLLLQAAAAAKVAHEAFAAAADGSWKERGVESLERTQRGVQNALQMLENERAAKTERDQQEQSHRFETIAQRRQARDEVRMGSRVQAELEQETAAAAAAAAAAFLKQNEMEKEKENVVRIAEAFMDVKALTGIEFDEEEVTCHKVKSRAAALEILFARGYNYLAATEVKEKVGFDLDEEALVALKALHTEDRVFMATFACFSPNDNVHNFRLSQQQRCLTNTAEPGTPYAALQLTPPVFAGIRRWRLRVNRSAKSWAIRLAASGLKSAALLSRYESADPPRRKSVVDFNHLGEHGTIGHARTALESLNAAEVEGLDVLVGASRYKCDRPDFKEIDVAGEGICFKRLQSFSTSAVDEIGINSVDVCWVCSSGAWKAFGSQVRQFGSSCVGPGAESKWKDGDCFSIVLDFNSGQVIKVADEFLNTALVFHKNNF